MSGSTPTQLAPAKGTGRVCLRAFLFACSQEGLWTMD
jgi:hypothetical protein